MKSAVLVFPGINRERDMARARPPRRDDVTGHELGVPPVEHVPHAGVDLDPPEAHDAAEVKEPVAA